LSVDATLRSLTLPARLLLPTPNHAPFGAGAEVKARLEAAKAELYATVGGVLADLQAFTASIAADLAAFAQASQPESHSQTAPSGEKTATATTSEPTTQVEAKADTASDVLAKDTTIIPTSDTALEITAVAANRPTDRQSPEVAGTTEPPAKPPQPSPTATKGTETTNGAV
jgi:hypothetical protein